MKSVNAHEDVDPLLVYEKALWTLAVLVAVNPCSNFVDWGMTEAQ